MLPESIQLVVVTPERQLLREVCTSVQLPGAEGELGILPGHAPLLTALGIGELTFLKGSDGSGGPQTGHLAVIRGFAEVLPDRVTVLAEVAERAEEIDVARAEKARQRAEKRLASQDTSIDWDRASAALQRAIIRMQVTTKGGVSVTGAR
jgi:F-type H+-transporting ATPase subunit epsilon